MRFWGKYKHDRIQTTGLRYGKALILTFCLMFGVAYADPAVQQPAATTPQNVAFENCTKMFAVNKEKLFYLTLGAISANKFGVEEIQTNNGYIIFTAARNKYLASIAGIDSSNSILKITPCNDIYYFQPGIINNMFKYIDLNLNMDIK